MGAVAGTGYFLSDICSRRAGVRLGIASVTVEKHGLAEVRRQVVILVLHEVELRVRARFAAALCPSL